ncbi:MAG: nicotinate (nicotinamide) nucleotide adenylyltransferase [Alphaproteobacteria bacterium]|nr:nicotinate (nicotinamide) nucleotide adenylyltransferase [Alphaproteobacteria bacterium]
MNWIAPPGPVADGLRIGLLGGSFNPAHAGHLYVSETARKRLGLDAVWWLVSPGNPLKDKSTMAPLGARLDGARKIAGRDPAIHVSALEQQLGTTYTVDTVKALQRRFPGVDFVWLMGSDNLEQFSRWRRWDEIARHIPIAVIQRPGSILAALNAPLVRRFGMVREPREPMRPPLVMVLDGARNSESATRLRLLGR